MQKAQFSACYYLKDSLTLIIAASEEAKKRGITLGVKLVRGAYMKEENEAAKSLHAWLLRYILR